MTKIFPTIQGLFKRAFTREISSRDEIIRVYGEKSLTAYIFLPRWNFIPGWTHPCQKDRDEILSRDEKRKKKACKNFIFGLNFTMSIFLLNFWRMFSVCFPTLTCLNIMKVRGKILIGPFYKTWSPKNHLSFIIFVKFTKDWNFPLFLNPCSKVSCIVLNARN